MIPLLDPALGGHAAALVWAVRAVSFFNTIALLWLGLAVLLNAERRTAGTWMASGGLVLGGLVFAGHTAVAGRNLGTYEAEMEFWWRAGWLPLVGAPYLWYLVMAWYSGRLRSGRHRVWAVLVGLGGLAAVVALLVADPLPSYSDLAEARPVEIVSLGGFPIMGLLYPGYSVLCIILAVWGLGHPEASERFMGELGRHRARPWLVAASLVLLLVSVSVGGLAAWFLHGIQAGELIALSENVVARVLVVDLGLSALVGLVVVLMGRAIVSYEVFTGKTLPRRGLFRHWRSSLVLAAGYGVLVGGSLALPVDPIYPLLLATVLIAVFYALLSWRSYVERERSIEGLRPFVRSQRLYDRLLGPTAALDVDIAAPLAALCDEVLGARVVCLAALGPLGPLVGQPLWHPPAAVGPLPSLDGLEISTNALCLPVDPTLYGGAAWAVPLGSERGLVGLLLLGEKRDGGLYTQEEIEVARSAGERLIDARASGELARRLMALARQRLAESQVLDQRTRRALHDDVLPRLHAAMLALGSTPQGGEGGSEVQAMLAGVHRHIAGLLRELPTALAPEVERLGLVGALRQAVDGELGGDFDGVRWMIDPDVERVARSLPPLTAEVLFCAAREAVRNAARHGRGDDPARPLHLTVSAACREGLEVTIADDGLGFGGGGATNGSGHGLGLHGTLLAVVGGSQTAATGSDGSTRVVLTLPAHALLLGQEMSR